MRDSEKELYCKSLELILEDDFERSQDILEKIERLDPDNRG